MNHLGAGYLRAGADPQFTGNATENRELTYVLISHNVSVIRHMAIGWR